MISEDTFKNYFPLQFSLVPIWLAQNIVFLEEIPRKFPFEAKNPIGKTVIKKKEMDDFLFADSAMVIRLSEGLIIITGYSHAGICNIVEYARYICQEEKFYDILGGFHLLDPPREQLEKTIKYFEKISPENVVACHCIDLPSKIALSQACILTEVGSGIVMEYLKTKTRYLNNEDIC